MTYASDFNCLQCGQPMEVVRLECRDCGLSVSGRFGLTPLPRLTLAEQTFVSAFVQVHGNIKKMERIFRVSYPTIKNRLNVIARKLDANFPASDDAGEVLDQVARGEITVAEALKRLG